MLRKMSTIGWLLTACIFFDAVIDGLGVVMGASERLFDDAVDDAQF